jgi:hypothetical protein
MSVKAHGGHIYAKNVWMSPCGPEGHKSVNARYNAEEARALVTAISKLLDLGYPEIDVAHYLNGSKVRKSDGFKQVTVNSSADPLPEMTLAGPGLWMDLIGFKDTEGQETWEVRTLDVFADHIRVQAVGGSSFIFGHVGRAVHQHTMLFLVDGSALVRIYPRP